MSDGTDIILFGGGSAAVEICFFLEALGKASGPGVTVSAVVDGGAPRRDAICESLGHAPAFWSELPERGASRSHVLIAIGDPAARNRVLGQVRALGYPLFTLIHPDSVVAGTARIGAGCIVAPKAYIGPFAVLEDNAFVNVGASIGHDVRIGQSATVSPLASVNGYAHCQEASFVGANASVFPGKTLGRFSKLAAGSVMTRDFGDGFILHGNPAKGRQMIRVDAPEG